MSVKIYGLNKLKSNWYNTIMIREHEYEYEYIVNIKGEKINLNTIKNNDTINLKGYTDIEIINYIIEKFLDSASINRIEEQVSLPYYDGKFACVSGNRKLYLNLDDTFKDISKKILNKYLSDRLNYIYKNNDNEYSLTTSYKESCYGETSYDDMNLFTFLAQGRKLALFEKEFITEFINYKLKSIGEKAEIIHSKIYSEIWENYINAKYLVCGDLKIRISDNNSDLSNCIESIVYFYNKNIEDVKKKQLKLEV